MSEHVIDRNAWAAMDIFQQMGNIGSEVGRALKAKQQGQQDRMQAAFYRGLDLIDLTAQLWAERKYAGLKELLYARELFAQSITTDRIDPTLEDYFMHFAITARMRQGV